MNKKSNKVWAVVKNGRIVVDEANHLRPMLVFPTKAAALAAIWLKSEKVVEMSLVIKSGDRDG